MSDQNGRYLDITDENALETLASVQAAILAEACDYCHKVLVGRQKRFCSRLCCSRWWDQEHPRINRQEGPRQGTLKAGILTFLAENPGWHTEQQIADAIHAFAHSVGARLSELRRAGHPIETERLGRLKRYRLGQ